MLTLSLSTSSAQGSLCLGIQGKILGSDTWIKQTSHSEKITESLAQLLSATGKSFKDIQQLVCTNGPGSFTGIRVGLSVVRSLAHSLDVPVVVLDDCLAIALNGLEPSSVPRLVLVDAQKNKVFAGIYLKNTDPIKTLLPPTLLSFEELSSLLPLDQYTVMGDGERFLPAFSSELQKKLVVDSDLAKFPHAEPMYQFVHGQMSTVPKIPWTELHPLYLRASAAEEVAAQKSGKKI